jgi:hypothetical protein
MLQDRRFFQIGMNNYVPAAQYAAAVIGLGPSQFDLGTPATAGALASLINAQGAVGPVTYLASPIIIDSTYGRTLTVTPSGVPGNANTFDVCGYDYLGQPLSERFTGSAAAATALVGLCAFKVIVGTKIGLAATNAITNTIGAGVSLGIPYKGRIIQASEGTTEMTYAQINTNKVEAVLTDPATVLTGDPRGLYTPTTAPNGTLRYRITMNGDPTVNAAGNGGLYGIRQFPF